MPEPQVLRPDPACWQEVRVPEPGLNFSICEMGVTTWNGHGGVKEVLGSKVLVTTTQTFLEASPPQLQSAGGLGSGLQESFQTQRLPTLHPPGRIREPSLSRYQAGRGRVCLKCVTRPPRPQLGDAPVCGEAAFIKATSRPTGTRRGSPKGGRKHQGRQCGPVMGRGCPWDSWAALSRACRAEGPEA